MTDFQKINRFVLAVVIVVLALLITFFIITKKKTPKRLIHASTGAVVNVVPAKRTSLNLQVTGTGLVQPLQEVDIAPQVSGIVVFTSPRLVQSGFFKQGELLFKLEDTDAILALEQAKAELTRTQLDLAKIEGQADIALQEWQLLNAGEAEPHPLVVYKPQLASAKAMEASARAKVTLAELDIQRTTVVAPFNCFIRSKNIEIGQYVRVGNVVLNLVGTDQAEIMVPLSLDDVAVVVVADKSTKARPGSPVMVRLNVGATNHEWQGYLDRFGGEIDATSRMLDVIVVVDDPYILKEQTSHTMPLVMGSFVAVDIEGREYHDVVRIPRMGLRDNSTVWLAKADSTLEVRPVTVLRKNQDTIIIDGGLTDGDQVILTPLRGASPGMKLRVQEQNKKRGEDS